MAVDKKSQHVGNHGGVYTDMEGMSKQFTTIDHDKKSKIHFSSNKEEFNMQDYRKSLIIRILDVPAALCPNIFHDFTVRGDISKILWNEKMLEDNGLPISQLRDLCTLCENRAGV